MLYGMYISAAGALANSYRQDVVANNLANVETVSFKQDLALFEGRRTEAQENGQRKYTTAMLEGIGGGLFALPTWTDFSPSSVKETGSDYDLALVGEGFFRVSDPDSPGGISYTRDGRFAHDQNNQLVTLEGHRPVLDQAGDPIVIDSGKDFQVDQTGVISQDDGVVGRLGIVDFDDKRVLRKQGRNNYAAPEGVEPQAITGQVQQNALEDSGVNSMDQLSEMIRTQRLFQSNISMLQIQDQSLGLTVTRLGMIV